MLSLVMFSFYYTDRIIEYSKNNNTILASINNYAKENDTYCEEGELSQNGIILGLSGLIVDKNKSYSNMKGSIFNEKLIEYKKDECITSKENNINNYIISGNKINKNISLVIDTNNLKYYKNMIQIFNDKNIDYNLLINDNFEEKDYKNILYKGKNIKQALKKYKNIYCVKTNNYQIINDCKKYKINSIKITNYIDNNLLLNTKKILNNGIIIFIKESDLNLQELSSTINYILSRGYKIVNIDKLLS